MSFAIRIVQPSSFLSVAATNSFYGEIKSAIASNAAIVLVDLKHIQSMSSANLIAVVKALKWVRASGCQLCLCSLNEQVRILFELTGLDQVCKIFADVNEFNRYIQAQRISPRNAVEVSRHTKNDVDVLQVDSFKLAS